MIARKPRRLKILTILLLVGNLFIFDLYCHAWDSISILFESLGKSDVYSQGLNALGVSLYPSCKGRTSLAASFTLLSIFSISFDSFGLLSFWSRLLSDTLAWITSTVNMDATAKN